MAFLLCGASLLRQLATKLHKKCKTPASSSAAASASASGSASPAVAAAAAAAASSSAAVSGLSSAVAAASSASSSGSALFGLTAAAVSSSALVAAAAPVAPAAVLRSAAAAARAATIIPRKALPAIRFCSDEEYTLAQLLGMKAPPASFWTLPSVNPSRVSALSRDGNPPAACSSLPTIEEGEEPLREPVASASSSSDDEDGLSVCSSAGSPSSSASSDRLSACLSASSLRPEDRGSEDVPLVDPLFSMLMAKVQAEMGEDADDDDDSDDDLCSCTSFLPCRREMKAVQEKCSAFVSSSSGACAPVIEPTCTTSSDRLSLSVVEKDTLSEPVGVEQALDSSVLKPAPLSIRKTMAETPPVAHPEPLRVLVTYPRGAHSKLHPALEALCLHLNA